MRQRGRGEHDPLAEQGMAMDELPVVRIEWSGFVEYRAGDRGLADVMQLRGQSDALHLVLWLTQRVGDAASQFGDMTGVHIEPCVLLAEHLEEHVGELAAGR